MSNVTPKTRSNSASTEPTDSATPTRVVGRLSRTDRWLPLLIGAAILLGLALGRSVPEFASTLDAVRIGGLSLPIAIGLLAMMYPMLAKVRYERIGEVTRKPRLLVLSLILNWLVGPALMFTLAWLLLPDHPAYRNGLIIIGLARCIAMVLVWNDLACGDREAAAVLVVLNSLFQITAYAALGWFYLSLLPSWLGLPQQALDVSMVDIARAVLIFLGIPLVAGYLTSRIGTRLKGADWYHETFAPRLGPMALYGLLFTVVVLFALQGEAVTSHPFDVALIALPLIAYFALMWSLSFATGRLGRLSYPETATLAFTAAGNNFDLAIAVAIATFGLTSGEALATVVGPLVEVPALVALVYLALWLRPRIFVRPQDQLQ